MKIQTTIRKNRLVKTIFLLTAILVAALFLGSAVSAGIARTTTTPIEKTQPSGDYSEDSRTAPIIHNEGELEKTQPTTSIKTTILSEGFEGTFPPTGWTQIITDAGYTWKSASSNPHGGTLYTNCEYDPDLVSQDEWLVTPVLDFTGYGSIYLSFWWYSSYYWGVSPYDNYDINVKISTDGGSTWTQLWNEDTIGTFTNWEWYDATFGTPVDLSSYIGQTNVKIGFQYIGTDGAEAALDDILIYGSMAGDHNLGILSIDTPESGNAGTITPTVTIQNLGTSDEFNVPLHMLIGKRQVTGTIEDFETTNGGYTATGTPTIIWEWGTPTLPTGPSTAHSGVNVWGTDLNANYPNSTNNKLDTPSFVVPPYAELTFWHWYDTEGYYDGGNVKISTDDGATWTIITPAGGYPEDAASTGNAGIPGQACFSGNIQKYWEKESFDLTAYSGQTVKIRFHFGSDSSVGYPGWYIDDVGITTSAWVNEYNQTQNFNIASGETIQVTMPAWTPADINVQDNIDIDYLAEADVTVTGDIDPADNYLAKPLSLHFGYYHDVAITEIVSPTTGPAEETTPEVILANNGQNNETVNVNMNIEKILYSNQWTQEQYSGQGIWERWGPEDGVYCKPASGSGSFMAASSDDHSGWTFDVEIFTHSMDMTGETSVDFSCAENFQDLGADDTAQIGIYSGGVLQETAYYQYGVDDPSGGGVVLYNFDPSTYPDPSDVQIGFYYNNGDGTYDWGFGIDDILVESATVTYIDWDFEASTFPPSQMSFIPEYNETVTVDVPFGESMNVVFPEDWIPSDITLSVDLDYRVSATAALGGSFNTIGTEDFEFYTPGHYGFPSGWTVSQTNPASTWFVYGTGTTHTSKCQETGSQNLAQNELLTSPSFNFAGMNAVKLQYSAYFYRAITNGDSYVEVVGSIDGGVSWPQLIKNYTATGGVSYSEDIDISAWAANQPSVTIGYRFVSDADINLTDYFYFDNLWTGNEVSVVTEGFSSYTPGYYGIPSGWTVTPTNPSTWFVYGTGTTHQMKCQETGSLNLSQNEFLTSPVFNLGGMTVVKLQYSAYFYRAITNGDSYVQVVGSIDGGVSWPQLIKNYTATGGVSYSEDIDISAWAANQPTVQIGYRFVSTADINLTDYFYFDNFWIGNEVPTLTENFNNWVPAKYGFPSGWIVTQTNPTSTWFVETTTSTRATCKELGSNNLAQDEVLKSPLMDLSTYAKPYLQYAAYWYNPTAVGDSYCQVLGSTDGGATWPTLIKNYSAISTGTTYTEKIDISGWAATQANVKIGYRFVSTADTTLTAYIYFDNFLVNGTEIPKIYENFSSYTAPKYGFPTGWTVIPTNPTSTWKVYGTVPTTSTPKCEEVGSVSGAQDELLTSPTFDLSAILTTVKLQYQYYWYRSSTGPDSYCQVLGSTDGGATWPNLIVNYSATGTFSGNAEYNITSWAAGQASVKIAFRFVSTADASMNDYFWFDNFWIGQLADTPVFSEYFEGTFPPTGWSTVAHQNAHIWHRNDFWATARPNYAGSGFCADADADKEGSGTWWPMNTSLYTAPIDLSSVSSALLKYRAYYYLLTNDYAKTYISIDNGTTWTLLKYQGALSSTLRLESIDITPYCGYSQVKLRFLYYSSGYDYYWEVDNITIIPAVQTYSSAFDTNILPPSWGPLGWSGDSHWINSATSSAGGTSPELKFSYGSAPYATGDFSFYTAPIDTSAYTALTLSFKEYIYYGYYPFTLKVITSTDGVTWKTVWSQKPLATVAAYTGYIPLTAADGIGSTTFRFGFMVSGYSYNCYGWNIDNIKLSIFPIACVTSFETNFVPASWGPLGWSSGELDIVSSHWIGSATNLAGGLSPELKFYYPPSVIGNFSFMIAPIDTSAYTSLNLYFKHYLSHSSAPYTLSVITSTDGITWSTAWSITPSASIPASTVIIPLTTANGIGSPTFQFGFRYSGDSYKTNNWNIDDIKLGTMVTIYTTTFNENSVPPNWGPLGWQVSPPGDTHWSQSFTTNAGGASPELKFYYSPLVTADLSFSSGPIDTSAYSELTMSFKHYVSHYTTPYTLKVETSSDGITWGTVWSISPTANIPATTVTIPLTTANGIGSTTFQMRFTFSGYTNNINYWYIDDVKLGTTVTVYTTTFNENWIPTNWGPAGWQQVVVSGTDPDNEWDSVTTSTYPSGVLPHGGLRMAQYDSYFISSGNSCRLYLPNPVDFSSIGSSEIQAKMWMYHDTGFSSNNDRVEVQVSLDGTTWITVGSVARYASVAHWEEHTFDFSAYAAETTVYIGFLGISEYGNSIYIDDLSLEYYGLLSDGNPSDNEMVNWITLTYTHDTGVTEITQPTGPDGNWPPGIYSVAGVIENLGSFTEYDVPVNAKIWKVDGKADILFYEENVTVPTLAIDGTAAVTFPDVSFENEDEGNFKLEMRTMLAGDDHPNNDKMTKTFIVQAPDTTPPVTTAGLTGTIGKNNWYVSNVTITLTATDPAGKILKVVGDGKWPLGVNHTYYKVDSSNWTEYTTPIVVTGDGQHKVCFYSDDKAIPPNVEAEKNVSFKMDTTAPEWINYSFTAKNLLKTKWLCVANVTDATSGIVLVEFYVDEALVGNATAEPYEFTYSGKPTNNSQAIAYDAAGNSAMSPIVNDYEYVVVQQQSQQQSTQNMQTMQTLKMKNI
jgi:hypothetical protein